MRHVVVALLASSLACGPVTDGGALDGGPVDASTGDAGDVDGGSSDAGALDGGSFDGGALDGGATDAGDDDAGAPLCDVVVDVSGEGLSERALTVAPGASCAVVLSAPEWGAVVDVTALGATLSLRARDDEPGLLEREPGFLGPFVVTDERVVDVAHDGAVEVALVVRRRGPPPDEILAERSLAITDSAVVDDPGAVGLARVMSAMADDGHGGALFAHWMRTFATTAHSTRTGPGQLVDEHALTHGDDASTWDLTDLPFKVTGVHTRMDLASDAHCGELRVSLASTHAVLRPLHFIFLFAMSPGIDDVTPSGALHCTGRALALARLSSLDEQPFVDAVHAILDEGLTPERFLLAESVEFTISPWEWRQWVRVANDDPQTIDALPFVVDNPPLFMTLDIARVNAPGPLRDAFLTFVEANAPALSARSLLLPESFRSPSSRLNDGVPFVPVDLTGLDDGVSSAFPTLAGQLAITGCPACHTADASFVQTREDRTFSPFYTKELVARAAFLDARARGLSPSVPFGPLQDDPVLP